MMTCWPECLKIVASPYETRLYFQKGQLLTNSRFLLEIGSDLIFEFGCGTIKSVSWLEAAFLTLFCSLLTILLNDQGHQDDFCSHCVSVDEVERGCDRGMQYAKLALDILCMPTLYASQNMSVVVFKVVLFIRLSQMCNTALVKLVRWPSILKQKAGDSDC